MGVCRVGREPIEYHEDSGEWMPAGPVPEHHGACMPAIPLSIEIITAEMQPRPCSWCAWRSEDDLYGALYLINGKGCCEVHVERAVREETVVVAARDALRTNERP